MPLDADLRSSVAIDLALGSAIYGISTVLALVAWWVNNSALTYVAIAVWILVVPARRIALRNRPAHATLLESDADDEDPTGSDDREISRRSLLKRLGRGSDTDRLLVFTDGVYAIGLTVLALRLVPPEGSDILTNEEIWQNISIQPWGPFFLTFFILGSWWQAHVRTFDHIQAATPALMWLDIAHLLPVVFLPIPLELQSKVGDSRWALLIYFLTFIAGSVTLQTLSIYGYAKKMLAPSEEWVAGNLRGAYFLITWTIGVVLVLSLPEPANSFYVFLLLFGVNPVVEHLVPVVYKRMNSAEPSTSAGSADS